MRDIMESVRSRDSDSLNKEGDVELLLLKKVNFRLLFSSFCACIYYCFLLFFLQFYDFYQSVARLGDSITVAHATAIICFILWWMIWRELVIWEYCYIDKLNIWSTRIFTIFYSFSSFSLFFTLFYSFQFLLVSS